MLCLPDPFILEVYYLEKKKQSQNATRNTKAITKAKKEQRKKAIAKGSQKNTSNHKSNNKANKIASKNGTTQPGFLAHLLKGSTFWRAFGRGSTFWCTFGEGSTFWCTFGRLFFSFLRRRLKSHTVGRFFCADEKCDF